MARNMAFHSAGGRLALVTLLSLITAVPLHVAAKTFYVDDPLIATPPPLPVQHVAVHPSRDFYDFYKNSFGHEGEQQRKGHVIPAEATNTLGEVPDSSWYTKRHFYSPMTIEELVRGPGNSEPPAKDAPWTVTSIKNEGVALGLRIQDSKGRKYLLKFDPVTNPEMATAADVIGSKFFYALGYNVPENYIVYFDPRQLKPGEKVTERQISQLLHRVPRDHARGYRAMASRIISGEVVGPFTYYGTRKDDPNDIVLHERRRDLRGLFVFSAWVNRDDAKADNSLDVVVKENGIPHIKHYLIDFSSSLGSSNIVPKSARNSHAYLFTWDDMMAQVFSLGLYVPGWARASYPQYRAVGRFDYESFKPDEWKSHYPIPAFIDRLPQDSFWAAKQVMAFTDDEIRAMVKTGQITNPAAEQWIVECLIARRNRIGQAYFAKVAPLDHFAVWNGQLVFEDLAVRYDLASPRKYTVQWSSFNNDTGQKSGAFADATTFAVPHQLLDGSENDYVVADIQCQGRHGASVYLRKRAGRIEVVGVERVTWAG